MAALTIASRGSRARRANSEATADGSAVLEKTQEFFQICDLEDKGFITRRDMQRLHKELPLSAEDLEDVFDTLDADGNGYLTLEEFSSGFSEFMFGNPAEAEARKTSSPEVLYESRWEESRGRDEEEEEKHFCMLMDSLGASNVFEEPTEVRSLWAQLRRDEPRLLSNFEEFLARVTLQIKEANQERREMESALKRKAATHDDEIQRLYEEMEQQIKNEKDRIMLQDSERFLSRSQDLEHKLSTKEHELDLLFQKQKRLEFQCRELSSERQETKVQNMKLKQTNEELSRDLEHTSQELALAQEQLALLQEQASRLDEEREIEMYRITEGLQRERTSLLKQLDLLREMNKHLRDEHDTYSQAPKNSARTSTWSPRPGSISVRNAERRSQFKSDDEEEVLPQCKRRDMMSGQAVVDGPPSSSHRLQRIISIEEDHLPGLLQDGYQTQLQDWSEAEEGMEEEDDDEGVELQMSSIHPSLTSTPSAESRGTPTSPRGQPVGKETVHAEEGVASAPDRLFKVVLVGNSSVGKTSLLRRFCDGSFHPGTSATVGIDYRVKTLTVDGSQVALQLWDTAGQERYRSITKQFFRKADGVVIVYDVTTEQSFTAVRHWLASVQDGAGEEDLPIMLLGNKADLDKQRQVPGQVGEALAKDKQLMFHECSACSGHNVLDCMVRLARILKEQEDHQKEKTVQLVGSPCRKKACC
ncbi:ras and EF-hand domain-containing protein homolog [Denticeps clupeoides]|uniref:EF-hand domain-containing protein n=1 Tax=Denticeps clupeoides TaxID=299321 RepID=A0AAY4E2R8_9TELE|nr:EF-hand calcium-binding domain-containing protein 4B [Denticeps clupeoides]XP_028813389.1 EF-hand calcium-binding domain-containing protein 4B [Denticeps clupeoides]XP_028813390.1 EF-hand calcium-binding domain-containing protein 4B [Denticeps clupeoides]XP_028813392.1 EF-hand calcium-binding domain-containing protein 4B [Denticeps clupeoides]